MEGASPIRPWLHALVQRDPQFVGSHMATYERILKDGAIPAKYKLLMAMVTEALEVAYLYGGTAALVMGVNAFPS
jgi:hypothetical protein